MPPSGAQYSHCTFNVSYSAPRLYHGAFPGLWLLPLPPIPSAPRDVSSDMPLEQDKWPLAIDFVVLILQDSSSKLLYIHLVLSNGWVCCVNCVEGVNHEGEFYQTSKGIINPQGNVAGLSLYWNLWCLAQVWDNCERDIYISAFSLKIAIQVVRGRGHTRYDFVIK